MSGHECPAPGCERRVPSSQFACRAHWYSLPKDIRDAIWAGYNKMPLGEAHINAMERATAYLEAHA